METRAAEPLVFTEHAEPIKERTSSAYRVMALIDAMMHTDEPEVIAYCELALQESYDDFKAYAVALMERATDLQMSVVGIDHEIERLQTLRDMRKRRAERLQSAIMHYMQHSEITEIVTDLWTLKLRKNPPAVEVRDESLIPADYRVVKVVEKETIDKKAIADALKNGVPVEGCALITRNRLEVK
jgi:hypothetical protein